MRDRLRRLGQWLGWMSASGLLAISLSALAYGHFLQAELDRAFALGMAQNALAAPLEQGDEAALREVTRALFEHAGLGFRYIAVRGEATDLGASYGRYENLSLPLVSAALRHRLRDALYRLTSVGGQHRIQRDGQVIGTLDYAISRDFRDSVESDAVRRLRTVGLAGTALSLPLLISLWLQLRARAGAAKTDPLRQRLMARSTGEPSLAPRGRGDVGRLDGEQLDRLGLAQIVADPEGRILSLNRTAESLCGWSADDVERRPVYTVFHAVDGAGRPAPVPLETVLRDGVDLAPHAGFLKPRQGQPLPVQMMASVIHNADGMVVGAVQVFHDRSLQAAAEADSARRQARAEAVLDALEDGVLITDEAGVIRASNRRARELFGYPPTQLEGGTVTKLMPVPFLNTPGIRLDDFVAPTPDLPRVVGWRRDASTFPVDLRVRPLQTHDGALRMVTVRDISDRLRRDNLAKRLERLLDHALEEVYVFDAQTLLFESVNRGARRNLGYSSEQLERMTPLSLAPDLAPETFQAHLNALRGGQMEPVTYRTVHQRADGSGYPVEVRLDYSSAESPPVFLMLTTNISERLAVEARLQAEARHDTLTGLPNRALLMDRLQQSMAAAHRTGSGLAVLFLDLDHFKQINDRFGHALGDQVLVQVAERLLGLVRRSDTVARLGGDEFVILVPHLRAEAHATALADKILGAFGSRLPIQGHDLVLTPSVGIALFPQDDADAEVLLRHADEAMYTAKQQGRGRWALHPARVSPDRQQHLALLQQLPAALTTGRLQLVWQTLAATPHEVLRVEVAWPHPQHGWVAPAQLRTLARMAGRSAELELWALTQLCDVLPRIAAEAHPPQVMLPLSPWLLREPSVCAALESQAGEADRMSALPGLLLSSQGFTEPHNALVAAALSLRARGYPLVLWLDGAAPPDGLEVDALLRTGAAPDMTVPAVEVAWTDPGLPATADAVETTEVLLARLHRRAGAGSPTSAAP